MAQIATINPLNQFFNLDGSPLNNGKLYFGEEGKDPEQFPIQMYWDEAGLVPALQPIRTTSGYAARTGSPAILYCGSKYSLRVLASNDVQVFYLASAGSAAAEAFSAFSPSNLTPSYVSASVFTVTGAQTAVLPQGLRLKFQVTAGTVYGTVQSSVYGALTTVTMAMDSGQSLDAGLSSFEVGFSPVNDAIPRGIFPTIPQNYGQFYGLTMSTAGASATMSIAAGVCTNSTSVAVMTLTAIAKTTSAWAVGTAAGGLDTGAIANSTKYYFYVIRRPDTGVVDVVFSLSSSAPTLPANYTQYRYIGMGLTNGSAQWTKFFQSGRTFWWDSPPLDVGATASVGSSTSYTLTVPVGRRVEAKLNVSIGSTAGTVVVYVHCPDASSAAASLTAAPLGAPGADDNGITGGQIVCLTNTSAQVAARANVSDTLRIATLGYTDTVGIDS